MTDDIDTTSADGFIAAFRPRAEAEFAQRVAAVEETLSRVSADAEALALFSKLVAMDAEVRAISLGFDIRGALTLDGTEAILHFVETYALVQRDCHAAAHAPDPDVREVSARLSLVLARGDHVEADKRHRAWLRERARYTEIRPGFADGRPCLSTADIIGILERNEALLAEENAWREAMDRRRREALARIALRGGAVPGSGEPAPLAP